MQMLLTGQMLECLPRIQAVHCYRHNVIMTPHDTQLVKSGEVWPGTLIISRNSQAMQPRNIHVSSLFLCFLHIDPFSFPLERKGTRKKRIKPIRELLEISLKKQTQQIASEIESQVRAPCCSCVVLNKRSHATIYFFYAGTNQPLNLYLLQ